MFVLDLFKKGLRSQAIFKLIGTLAGVDQLLKNGLSLETGIGAINLILAGFGVGYVIEKAQALELAKEKVNLADFIKAHR
ncbi:MAG TPA: hypothetical protein DCY13_04875 [Verrucomicrobiales bacterium]|nr:hypothetical protein [Verrucomicrobiales bacterium]